jgi:tripartite-type tricarboxylate transporter receptor subunit TctC
MNGPHLTRREAIAAAASLLATTGARAQAAWPAKTIRIVVGFGPGSTPDLLVRLFASELNKRLGQSVVVENRPGATGNIAADLVAKSAPDGYTLFYGTNTTHAINPSLYARLPFDPVKDFEPITITGKVWNVLLVNPRSVVSEYRTLIAVARTRPGELSFASGGNGTSLHLTGELVKQRLGLNIVHVPYKTGDAAFNDLAGGRVDMMFANLPSAMPYIQSGRVKALAVTSRGRSPLLPEVPSLEELGLKDFEVSGWGGLFAPRRTPQPVVQRLNQEMVAMLTDPTIVQKMDSWGAVAQHSSAAAFGQFVQSEIVRWGRVVKQAGARLD